MPVPLVTGATGFAGGHLSSTCSSTRRGVAAGAIAGGRVAGHSADPTHVVGGGRHHSTATRSCVRSRAASVGDLPLRGRRTCTTRGGPSARALRVNVIGTHICSTRSNASRAGRAGAGHRVGARLPAVASSADGETLRSARRALRRQQARAGDGRRQAAPGLSSSPGRSTTPARGSRRRTSRPSFARQIAEAEAGSREPVLAVGNLDARRDITDVRDTVRAYRAARRTRAAARPYNVCRGEAFRVGDLLDSLIRQARSRSKSGPIPHACGRTTIRSCSANPGRFSTTPAGRRDPDRRHAGGSARILASAATPSIPRRSVTRARRIRRTMRQWVHIAFGAVALLLPLLHWYQAVTLAAACAVVSTSGCSGRSPAIGCIGRA